MATKGVELLLGEDFPSDGDFPHKQKLRLLKNREAALECRRKEKDYIKCLENRATLLENQNKMLIEELNSLKELFIQKENTVLEY